MWTEARNARRLELLALEEKTGPESRELERLQEECEDYNHRPFERNTVVPTSLELPREYPPNEATRLYAGLKMLGGINY